MAYEEALRNRSYRAGSDLTTKQFCFVDAVVSSGVADTPDGVAVVNIPAGAGGKAIGVLQNNPPAGEAATVAVEGTSKVIAAGNITAGNFVQTNADGHAIVAASGDYVLGIARENAVDNDVISVELVRPYLIP